MSVYRSYTKEAEENARKEICTKYGKAIFANDDYLDWIYGGIWGSNAIYRHLAGKEL